MGKAARTSPLDTERTQTRRENEGLKQSHNRCKSGGGMTLPSEQGETGEGRPHLVLGVSRQGGVLRGYGLQVAEVPDDDAER